MQAAQAPAERKSQKRKELFVTYSTFRHHCGKVRVETLMKCTRMTSAVIKQGSYLAVKREVTSWGYLRKGH